MLTIEQVRDVLNANGCKDTEITCPDGARATVSPCLEYGAECNADNAEYFLIYWDMPWGGANNLAELTETLNRHAALAAEQDDDERKLRAYFDEHQRDGWSTDALDFFSDWHKDVFGYRPRGCAFGEAMRY